MLIITANKVSDGGWAANGGYKKQPQQIVWIILKGEEEK